jgi:hypothetical protein
MRIAFLAASAAIALAVPALAQQQDMELPEIVIGGDNPPPLETGNCVEVEVDGKRTFNCLNRRLEEKASQTQPTINLPPINNNSSDISRGIVNVPALKQQFGPNYGVSVQPYRPPKAPIPPKP